MRNCYRVYYVGEDSKGHSMVVRAKNHAEAVEKVKRATETDVVSGVCRCMNPYVKAAIVALSVLLVLSLLVVSCVRAA